MSKQYNEKLSTDALAAVRRAKIDKELRLLRVSCEPEALEYRATADSDALALVLAAIDSPTSVQSRFLLNFDLIFAVATFGIPKTNPSAR